MNFDYLCEEKEVEKIEYIIENFNELNESDIHWGKNIQSVQTGILMAFKNVIYDIFKKVYGDDSSKNMDVTSEFISSGFGEYFNKNIAPKLKGIVPEDMTWSKASEMLSDSKSKISIDSSVLDKLKSEKEEEQKGDDDIKKELSNHISKRIRNVVIQALKDRKKES